MESLRFSVGTLVKAPKACVRWVAATSAGRSRLRFRPVQLLAGLLVVGGVLLLAPLTVGAVVGRTPIEASVPPHGPAIVQPKPGRAGPQLPVANEIRAREIAGTDPLVQRLIAGSGFSVSAVGPWQRGDDLIGAAVEIRGVKPVDVIDGAWPRLSLQAVTGVDAPLPTFVQRLTVRNVVAIMVYVDLKANRVVSVSPIPRSASDGRLETDLPPGADLPLAPAGIEGE